MLLPVLVRYSVPAAAVLLLPVAFSQISEAQSKSSSQASAGVRFVQPETLPKNPAFTNVVEVTGGKLVFVAGQLALDKSGNIVGHDMQTQATQVFENLQKALEAAGGSLKNAVKLNAYLMNMDDLPAYSAVRNKFLAGNTAPPASTTIAITRLAREGALLEVEVVAAIP